MGLFKKLFVGVVAIAAAPVVAPMAAAAAAGAAAAGVAAAGAAATAAAGAVGAAGAAVAGTAVGGAAIGAMGAVGTAVGTAAGAVGITSVATVAGTATGAAAVGTIATSAAVGAQQAYSAKSNLDEAKEIEAYARDKYKARETQFARTQNEASRAMSDLADNKKKIAERLQEFNQVFRTIKNPTEFGTITINDTGFRAVDTGVNWEAYPIALQKLSEGILTSYASGNIVGLAVSGGLAFKGVAGTGAAISGLSGAAATNATLAALGGGTLAHGGLGMAGGAMVAKGLVFAPAFAIGGMMLNYKSSEVLDDARRLRWEVENAVANMDRATPYLNRLTSLSTAMSRNIDQTFAVYTPVWNRVRDIVYTKRHTNAARMTRAEKLTFFAAIGLAKVMELQATKSFVRAENTQDEYDVNSLINTEAVHNCRYNASGLVQIGKLPAYNLDQVIQQADASTRWEAEEQQRQIEQQRLAEQRRLAEQQRMAEQRRLAEQQRMAEQQRAAEQAVSLSAKSKAKKKAKAKKGRKQAASAKQEQAKGLGGNSSLFNNQPYKSDPASSKVDSSVMSDSAVQTSEKKEGFMSFLLNGETYDFSELAKSGRKGVQAALAGTAKLVGSIRTENDKITERIAERSRRPERTDTGRREVQSQQRMSATLKDKVRRLDDELSMKMNAETLSRAQEYDNKKYEQMPGRLGFLKPKEKNKK